MTLLVISPDFASHALPLITLAGAWRDRGEAVVVATGSSVAPLVAREGLGFVRLSMSPGSNGGISRPEDQPVGEDDHLRAFFEATRGGMVATLRYQAEARARDLLWQPVEVARRTLALVDAVRPDAILIDHLAFAAGIGLRAGAIPYVDVVLGHPRQLPVGRETYGMPSAWPAAFDPQAAGLQGLEDLSRDVARSFTATYNDALRSLAADAALVDDAFAAHGDVVLFNYPSAVRAADRDPYLPARHAFLGATLRRESATGDVAAWLERDAARPLVVVSLGTFLSARDDVLGRIADALRAVDARVAIATGSTAPQRLGPLPPDWLVAPFLPQTALLDRAALLVTHAGNNSVTEALASGVPMLALPFSTDQFDGAAAIETHGLGRAADPNRASADELRMSIRALLDAPPAAVRSLAGELAAAPGALVARNAVDGWLRPAVPPAAAGRASPGLALAQPRSR